MGFFRHLGAVGLAVLILGVAGAGLMFATEISVIRQVEVTPGESCAAQVADPKLAEDCELRGGEQHSWALIPLALLTALMAYGAGVRRSRPAALALAAVGVAVLAIALIGDAPGLDDAGLLSRSFAEAKAKAGTGFTLEVLGGALTLFAGALALTRGQPPRAEPAPAYRGGRRNYQR